MGKRFIISVGDGRVYSGHDCIFYAKNLKYNKIDPLTVQYQEKRICDVLFQ